MRKIAALAVVMGLALPAAASAQHAGHPMAMMPSGTRLDITAEGEARRVPDVANVSAGVMTQAQTAAAAMQTNSSRMAAVVSALRKAGIADRDIQTSGLSLSPQYRYQDNQPPQLVGYQASNMVQVTFRKIGDAGKIIDTLVAQGANQINGPSLSVDKPDAALDEARAQAVAKARSRAELYAKAAGLKVKRIVSISEAGAAPPPMPYAAPRMAMAEAKADTAIEPGETRLAVTLNVSFELE